MLAILLGSIKTSLFIRFWCIRDQLGQGDRARSDKVVAADLVPVEQGELDVKRVFVAPDVEQHLFVPRWVEAEGRGGVSAVAVRQCGTHE